MSNSYAAKLRRQQEKRAKIAAKREKDAAPRRLLKGDKIDVKITRIGYGGTSIGTLVCTNVIDGPPIIDQDVHLPVHALKGACPGDVIRCCVTRVRRRKIRPHIPDKSTLIEKLSGKADRSYIEASFGELLTRSSIAVPPPCEHFGHYKLGGGGCGGCTSMHTAYDYQLQDKDTQMKSLFTFLADKYDITVNQIIPCEVTLQYRNKMEFTLGRRWHPDTKDEPKYGDLPTYDYSLGLHPPQRFDKVIEISKCQIQPSIGNDILQYIRVAAPEMLLEPYDTKKNTGYFRNVGIRTSTNASQEQEVMVNLITSPCEVPKRLLPLARQLREKFPQIVCVLQNIRGVTGTHVTDEGQERLLAGPRSYIEQTLSGVTFRISANSFFQTNPAQAAVLYDQVRQAARLSSEDVVLDLFCGTGTIGLSLASVAKHVHGVDVIASSIDDARVNASANGIKNASFLQLNLDKVRVAKKFVDLPEANVIIVDPPRAGLHPGLVKYFAASPPKRIVYVSCNPMTQVRDIMELMEQAPDTFRLASIQPVDMFPNTSHVECVIALDRL